MSVVPKCNCGHSAYHCNGNEHCLNKPPSELYETFIRLPSLELPDFKKLRKECGLTLRQVETDTGISNPYLSQLETGKVKHPSYKVAVTLIHYYFKNKTNNENT